MEQKTIKILEKLPDRKGGPFEWTAEFDGETKKISSWEKRDLLPDKVYLIKLLDETAMDIQYNQRRISKAHEESLVGDTGNSDVIKAIPTEHDDQVEQIEQIEQIEHSEPKPKTKSKDKPKAKAKIKDEPLGDDFNDEFANMIDEEENDKPVISVVDQFVNTNTVELTSNKLEMVIPKNSKLELSQTNVKKYLCPNATESEIYMFMQLCINQGLNPFIGDAYLVKYGPRAQMIVSKDAFLKKAEQLDDYRGFEAGVIVTRDKGQTFERREGALKLDDEILIGGWAKVYREGKRTFYAEVSFKEYDTGKAMWANKPATMIRKVSIVQALRESFPQSFQGMYDGAEINTNE